jgi:ABC-type sugar transport system substrate-binding protein
VNASQALRRGVDAYDVAPSDPAALHAVLVAADARGTITPW